MAGGFSDLGAFLGGSGLTVAHSEAKGRCLVASRLFSRGVEIFEQEAYVAVLDASSQSKRCDRCYRESSNLKRCSACKIVFYCCATCQKKEWALHKHECGALVKLFREKQRTPTPTLRLMVRLLVKRRLQSDGVLSRTASDCYEACEVLPTHIEDTGEERLILYAQMANLVQSMVAPDEVEVKEITQILGRFACNAHTICDEELRPMGTGLYPVISIINHSCSPNGVLHFDGKRAVVRALEDIEEGTEVTISYVDLAASTQTRRKALKDQYYFDCNCTRCRHLETLQGSREDAFLEGYRCTRPGCEGPLLPDPGHSTKLICDSCGCNNMTERKTIVAEAEQKTLEASKLYTSGNIDGALKMYIEVENLQVASFHPFSIHLMRTRDSLLKIYMDLGDWTAALEYCRKTMKAYERELLISDFNLTETLIRAYPPFSPLLGLQLYTLGKLEWLKENTREAIDALGKASRILQVTHGPSSSLVQSLLPTLQEAHAEAAHLHLL